MKKGSVSAVRVIAIGGVLGAAAGIGLSFYRHAQAERALAQVEAAPDQLSGQDFPAAPQLPPPAAGPLKLAALEGLPPYPNAYVRPLTSTEKGKGPELNVAWFATRDDIEDVLRFYEKEFHAKHKLFVSYQFSPVAGYVGYMDLADERMHLISVLKQNGETLVFPSSSYPRKMVEGASPLPKGLPAIAGTEGGFSFDLGEAGQRRQVWMSTFKGRTVDDVAEAWRQGLIDKGWSVQAPTRASDVERHLDARGPEGALTVTVRRDASSIVAVYVSMSGA